MNKLTISFVAAMSLLAFAGCKKKGGAAGEAVAKMEGFQKSMCDCKDKACAEKVTAEMSKWGEEMAKKPDKAVVPTEAQTKEMTESTKKMGECMAKAMGG